MCSRLLVPLLFVFKIAVFLTELKRGYTLAGVQNTQRIKCRFYIVELLQLLIVELHGHLPDFLHTHSMLTGNAATDGHA